MQIKKKDVLELDIIDYSFGGKGIAKISIDGVNKFVVFVENAYPGEKVKAELKKIKKNYAEASLVEIIKPSEYRTEAICEHFGVCGGCKALDLKYDYQLFYKDKQIKESFEKIGTLNLNEIRFYDILGCEQNLYYRNKVEFSFAPKRWLTHKEVESNIEFNDRFFALGFHVPNNYDKVININQCHIVDKVASEILVVTRNYFSERNVTIYDNASNSGLLRNLVVRKSFLNDNFMVILITSSYEKDLMNDYKNMLISKFYQISTIVVGINSKKSMVAVGDEYYTLYGDGYLVESIGKFKYKISPKSFFQTNTIQAKKLYDKIIELAEFEKNDIAYDLFCGAGTITNYVSEYVSKVYGFEVVEQSILDAKENALSNNVTNVEFIHFDLNKSLLPVIQSNSIPRPDVIILDPPRSGLHPNTIKDILNILPKKIVYVSCNPTTQARDLKELKPFYNVIKSQAVDMFPHTYHLENITILKLKES
ncbi:MAG TPA: 23S rRNA (uracil(1939)-C(5))-methyltransferase RlmD [Ignavibacteriales bacterium]|nr:23S rRNA (uracil(1939)-C(5))-methyltransferase RlmD [Ignavibacteriales bacterium]